MPSLLAILGLNASGFKGGLDNARRDAKETGDAIKSSLGQANDALNKMGGETGHVKSGAIRETLVLLREIGRGNWSRVPGSFSILVQQLGLLRFLMNPITLALVALGAGFYGLYKLSEKLAQSWSGLKWPEFHPEHIAAQLQK